MSINCLIDTSIFLEILNVENEAENHQHYMNELSKKIKNKESLFLPLATIIETGNHISQNGSGQQKRKCAQSFVEQVKKALNNESPFKPILFLDEKNFMEWIDCFPAYAMRDIGLGDLTIIKDFEHLCSKNKGSEIYIWTKDKHLSGHHRK